jgi:hypothetical protein
LVLSCFVRIALSARIPGYDAIGRVISDFRKYGEEAVGD